MRIATANLRHGGPTSPDNAWQRLLKEACVDVLCAQESRAPLEYFNRKALAGSAVFNPAPDRNWGSAIWSRHHPLEEFGLDAFHGHVTAARATDVGFRRAVVDGRLRQRSHSTAGALCASSRSPHRPSC